MGYERPDCLADALRLLASAPRTILAGGTDLYPATRTSSLRGDVLDITALPELQGFEDQGPSWRLGACMTWSQIIQAPLPPAFDALKLAAREVGAWQIQNAGTLAGNLCNASPAADGVPALLILDAEVELASAAGRRRLPLSDFIEGPRRTARRSDELMTAVILPKAACEGLSDFLKLGARKYLVISIAMVAVRVALEVGRIRQAALAVGSCSAVATRLPRLESALVGHSLEDALAMLDDAAVAEALSPIDDVRGSADYRRKAAAELLRRALRRLRIPEEGTVAA